MKVRVLSLLIAVIIIVAGRCEKPRITIPHRDEFIRNPKYGKDLVVQEGDTFHLRCEHNSPVNWSFPSFTLPTHEDSVDWLVDISAWYNNTSHMHGSTIQIDNASFRETGYFYCYNELATSHNDPVNSANVYVYIRSEQELFVAAPEVVLYATQYKPLDIDCRTTSPDVEVELVLADGELDPEDDINQIFNPRVGFSLQQVHLEYEGGYECNGRRDNVEKVRAGMIHVLLHVDSVPKPTINSTVLHAGAGNSLTLQCIVVVDEGIFFRLYWLVPETVPQDRIKNHTTTVSEVEDQNGNRKRVGSVLLTIEKTKSSDTGEYRCNVSDHASNTASTVINVTIFSEDTKFINLTDHEPIEVEVGKSVKWVVAYSAHPAVNIFWSFNGKNLTGSIKYNISTTTTDAKLEIFDITIRDSGVYRLTAWNTELSASKNMSLIVLAKPTLIPKQPDGEEYYTFQKSYTLVCRVQAYPVPAYSWYFRRCDDPPDCENHYKDKKIQENEFIGAGNGTSYHVTALLSGYYTCVAENTLGSVNRTIAFWVTEVPDGFEASSTPSKIYVGDNITLSCGVSKYNYTSDITWSFTDSSNPTMTITNNSYFQVERTSSNLSYKSSLTIFNATQKNSGKYFCHVVKSQNKSQDFKRLNITVRVPKPPVIVSTNMRENERSVKTNAEVNFTCNVEGDPKPVVTWFKDNVQLDKKSSKTINFSNFNQTMIITAAYMEGEYSCRATNRDGTKSESIKLTFNDKQTNTAAIVTISIISIIVIVLLVLLIKKIMKEKQLRKEVREMGLEQFEKGASDSINPDLPIDDQAELLPYDRKWEFPSEKLKLGKQLGAGAFGVVMKADAVGITEGEAISTVAVKMVKRNADSTYIKALASELKIMVHLGKHLNVVNLLGACTKNLNKRELYVIVEYCRFGNLHNYLLRHRSDFIDQVDLTTGKIDPTIGAEIIARHESMAAKSRMKFSALSFSRSRADSEMSVEFRPSPTSSDSREVNSGASLISMTPVGGSGEEGMMLSNNSIQPEWRSNYGGDYKGNVRPISTRDLLCWAFQVARGMEYLAGRKVLHGDLAARNILLADDNIVKICDFGLAKSMYKSDNYRKKGDGPLPIKWMAIESIRDRVFSTQSDVWSFGIVLWEFFSLAKTPYPGMEADEKLYNKLVEGYRMDRPEYATEEIFHIMDRCWKNQPCSRPSFGDLSEHLGNMLEDSVRMHYIDLNDPYMSMNVHWLENQKSDYLAMVTAPTYDNMVAPAMDEVDLGHHYINGSVMVEPTQCTSSDPDEAAGSGYLLMKPSSVIFSPRHDASSPMFNFPQKRQSRDETVRDRHESRPLTASDEYKNPSHTPKRVNDLNKADAIRFDANIDAGGSKENRPNFAAGFSNPSYASMPPMKVTPDNYVNMPQKPAGDANDFGNEGRHLVIDDGLKSPTTGDMYINIPNHGHNHSNASSGFQSDPGEVSNLN